ncbi:hypothetical protein HYN46_08155 [Aquirhabdus parva]|uniref:Uncharacterized protein n=1 Tax=Aquirhabdus parva TaxID=2283318 RepID=A0A345P6A0_9GAMM|nr:hypothetical protein HYN46_08155 [Aquirhabdus parva]
MGIVARPQMKTNMKQGNRSPNYLSNINEVPRAN